MGRFSRTCPTPSAPTACPHPASCCVLPLPQPQRLATWSTHTHTCVPGHRNAQLTKCARTCTHTHQHMKQHTCTCAHTCVHVPAPIARRAAWHAVGRWACLQNEHTVDLGVRDHGVCGASLQRALQATLTHTPFVCQGSWARPPGPLPAGGRGGAAPAPTSRGQRAFHAHTSQLHSSARAPGSSWPEQSVREGPAVLRAWGRG